MSAAISKRPCIILFVKGGKPGGKGLVLKPVTDKNGKVTRHWVKPDELGHPGQAQLFAEHGQAVAAPAANAGISDSERQLRDTERAYGGREAYVRARAAGKTRLNYGQWVQVRTPNFKNWFGDWEAAQHAAILQGEPIARLSTTEAPQGSFAAVQEWAAKVFSSQGGKAVRDGFGEVVLDLRSAKTSMAHGGANRYKKVAFAAIKDVIERGALVLSRKEEQEDSFYFSAPVDIDGVVNIETVLVHRDPNTQRMYLHSVTTKENLLNQRVSSADAEASGRSGSTDSEGISSVLRYLLRFNPANASKAVDPQTGEPLVVHHGTAKDFSAFDTKKIGSNYRADKKGFFFTSNASEAAWAASDASERRGADGERLLPVYLAINSPVEIDASSLSDYPL